MKKVEVKIELTLQVPDHVRLEKPNEKIGNLIFMDGDLFEPTVDWMKIVKIDEEGGFESVSADEKQSEELDGYIVESSSTMTIEE